jgi:Family of unknown function (DUF5338)
MEAVLSVAEDELSAVRRRAASPKRPRTKIGTVKWLWPEIHGSLEQGFTLKEIWQALGAAGVPMDYSRFAEYVRRFRKQARLPVSLEPTAANDIAESRASAQDSRSNVNPASAHDPFRNIREQKERQRYSRFEYNPIPDKDLLR